MRVILIALAFLCTSSAFACDRSCAAKLYPQFLTWQQKQATLDWLLGETHVLTSEPSDCVICSRGGLERPSPRQRSHRAKPQSHKGATHHRERTHMERTRGHLLWPWD